MTGIVTDTYHVSLCSSSQTHTCSSDNNRPQQQIQIVCIDNESLPALNNRPCTYTKVLANTCPHNTDNPHRLLLKHFRCFGSLLTGLHNAEFECWPHVDPSLDRPSHISCILVSWRGCCVCRWGGHLSSEMTPASVTVKCVYAHKCGLCQLSRLPAFLWAPRGWLVAYETDQCH